MKTYWWVGCSPAELRKRKWGGVGGKNVKAKIPTENDLRSCKKRMRNRRRDGEEEDRRIEG